MRKLLMNCPYKKKNYCSYKDKQCNPNALSCYLNHKQQNYFSAPSAKNEIFSTEKASGNETDLFPLHYDKTVSPQEKTIIFIYGGSLKIKKNKLKDFRLIVNDLIEPHETYPLYVICNTNSGYYYMGVRVLKHYMKKHYHPNVIFRYLGFSECTEPVSHIDMSDISILKMYGYTVGKNGLSKEQRHRLLEYILDNKIMKGHDIINLLQFNIAMREAQSRYDKALCDWQTDIEFVTDYFDR